MTTQETLERIVVTISIHCIPIDEVYSRFCQAILKATASIPRGFRLIHIPCLPSESADLLKKYEESGDPDIAEHVIDSLEWIQHVELGGTKPPANWICQGQVASTGV